MPARQSRQRPRSSSHETTGISSRGRMPASQAGQCERGRTTDSPRGTRWMTTFRNDPTTRPTAAAKTTRKLLLIAILLLSCRLGSSLSHQGQVPVDSPLCAEYLKSLSAPLVSVSETHQFFGSFRL